MTPEDKRGGDPEALGGVLIRLRDKIEDPEWQAAREREAAEAAALEQAQRRSDHRRQRAEVLRREAVPLRGDVEVAIIAGKPLESTKSLQATERWLAKPDAPPVLVLSGATGCGKTVAAAWAMAQNGGRWRPANQLCRIFAAQFGDMLDEQESVLRSAMLVIDDLGSEYDAPRMANTLLELVDNRQHSARRYRTIITTNLTRSQLVERYSNERLTSRFGVGAGIVAWASDAGRDMRGAR